MKKEKHGWSRTKLYAVWTSMKQRCQNPKDGNYQKYGALGVSVCNAWSGSFIAFRDWALENGYEEGLTIDRLNPAGDYEPGNCRWATYEEQNTHLRKGKNNKSGYIGISWSIKESRWIAMISIKRKSKRIGSFKTKKEAVIARNKFIQKNSLPHVQTDWEEKERSE